MMYKYVLLFSLLTALCYAVDYSREFQFFIDLDYFASGRSEGIGRYLESFAVKGFTVENMTRSESIRFQISNQLDNCGSNAKLRRRQYVEGDRAGLTLDIKSGESKTESEAKAEPFAVAPEYSAQSVKDIEYDIHPCHADYAATSRIAFADAIVNIVTCDDVRKYFPNFADEDGDIEVDEDQDYVYVESYSGTKWGGEIKLEFTLYYGSQTDAEEDWSRRRGEFSYTVNADADGQYTDEQTIKGIEVYEYMLADVGEPDYPCDPEVDIADFFEPGYGISGSSLVIMNILQGITAFLFLL